MITINPAPVACTLSTDDFRTRAKWLAELTARAVVSYREDGLRVHLTYRADAADDVEKMVRQEQQCCGFLQFSMQTAPDAVVVTITAPADLGGDARLLYAHLIPTGMQASGADTQ